jgi:hypothetical protein
MFLDFVYIDIYSLDLGFTKIQALLCTLFSKAVTGISLHVARVHACSDSSSRKELIVTREPLLFLA